MRVTVTIPIFNSSVYLDECFENIIGQTYRDFEVVFVIDYRTTDDSLQRIEQFCKDNENARFLIQNDDFGLAGARNIGIDNAEGEIIWFLDVDDHPYPSFLEEMVRVMDEKDVDIVFCNHYEFCKRVIPEIPDARYSVRDVDHDWALACFNELPVYSWCRIQKKSIFDDGVARFINRPAAEDFEQTLRSIYVSKKMCYYDKPLYVYYKADDTSMIRNRPREIEAMEETAKSVDELFKGKTGYPYDQMRIHLAERVMRQSAFSRYGQFSKAYSTSYAHTLLKDTPEKTKEMKVYSFSRLSYYFAIYPFTHYFWDRKEGVWEEPDDVPEGVYVEDMDVGSDSTFSSKVSLNMVVNMIRIVVMALVGLLMVPYYIDQFGMAIYAVLPLATSLTMYILIASDSLANSFSRYMIMAIQSGSRRKAITTYSSSVIGMTKTMFKIVPVAILISILSPYIFQIGSARVLDVQVMFALILLSSLLVSYATCYNSAFYAKNLLYLLYGIKTAYTIMQVGLIILFFVIFGPNLMLIGLSYLISSLAYTFALWIATKRIYPFLYVSIYRYDKNLLKEMTELGFWGMISAIGALMFIQTSLIMVNLFLGAETESEFSVVANMISMINTASMALTAAGEPLIYRYYSESNSDMLWGTLSLFTKFIGLIIVFPIAYIFIFTPQILIVWIGDEYEYIVLMAKIMVPANICVCSMHIIACLFLVESKLKEVSLATCFIGAFNVILACILLAVMDDPIGAAIAWAVSIMLLNAVFIPLYASKIMGISPLTFLKPIVLCYLVFGLIIGAGKLMVQNWTMPSSFLWVASTAFIGFVIYSVLVFFIFLNRSEKGILLTYFPKTFQNLVLKVIH